MAETRAVGERWDAKVLYITYDGLTDPLGRSQVLPYLTGLSERGHRITILSCEKPVRMASEGERIQQLCAEAGINWQPLRYHKNPPILSSMLDAAALRRAAVRIHRKERFDVVHCRSYIPARAGLALKRRFGVRFLFDMRGFWPDEKVEGNNWDLANPLYAAVYRYFKWLESRLLREADHIVSLTQAGKDQLLTRPELASNATEISVIPCCVDFDHFQLATTDARTAARRQLGIKGSEAVLAYLGSLGSWYMLEEMLDFFKVYTSRLGKARFLFVSLENPQTIRRAAKAHGVDPRMLIICPASREEVPPLMAAADLGIFFIKPVFSKTASSPTKMGEMLAVGLPIVTNAGIGDVAAMVEDMACGVVVQELASASYGQALDSIESLPIGPEERRNRAFRLFDVGLGIDRYDRIYRRLSVEKPAASNAASNRARNSSLE